VRTLPSNLRLPATTATANNRVMDDLRTVLGPALAVSHGDLTRPSLTLQSIHLPGQAERLAWLAEQLPNLPGSGIVYTAERPAQKTMANSSQQAHNLDGSLDIRQALPGGPVLLVDDMVDSRWTLTVAAWLLRRHGSGPVWPLALALTGHD